jgi:hypothetical protein
VRYSLSILASYCVSVFINNHTAVWGSWYIPTTGQWGYACCHSTINMSYCAGAAGIEANAAVSAERMLAKKQQQQKETPMEAETPSKKSSEKATTEKRRADDSTDEAALKKRRFNAGITEEELGMYISVASSTEMLTHCNRGLSEDSHRWHGRSDGELQRRGFHMRSFILSWRTILHFTGLPRFYLICSIPQACVKSLVFVGPRVVFLRF